MSETRPPQPQAIGRWMLYAFWVIVLGLLTFAFDLWLDRQQNPNQTVATHSANGYRETILRSNRHGHYVATGSINGEPVTFLLDTGASDVSVPAAIATRLGLERGVPVAYQTANGIATGYRTLLESVALGEIRLENVRGHINPNTDSDEILLGMSFLLHLELV